MTMCKQLIGGIPHRGLPNKDIYLSNGNVRYSETEKVWVAAIMICDIKLHKYERKQIATHVNSKNSFNDHRQDWAHESSFT